MCSKIDEFEYTFECGFEFETHNRNCISDNFLVDRIYDYHHNLLAQFIYDDENRLTKRIITTLSVHPIRTDEMRSEDKFEYRNGRVSRIINHTRSHTIFHQFDFEDRSEFRSETTFEYDSQGRLIRRNGKDLNFRYENGRIVGLFKESNDPFIHRDTLVYDNSGNIIKHIRIVPELTMFGQPIPGTSRRVVHHFEYDNRPRPNFGLDDLFVFQPLPQMGNFLDYQMLLSRNNLTKATEDRHAFVYTYNEFGLPATIEKIWLDCGESGYECVRNVLRIVYRRIR
jgi:hypothetical protein